MTEVQQKPTPASKETPVVQVTGGEKCADLCEKVGTLCKVVGAISPCGSLAIETIDISRSGKGQVKAFKKISNCIGNSYEPVFNKFADKLFIVSEGQEWTFKKTKEIYQNIGAEIRSSAGFGVNINESVGLCMKNCPEYMLGFLAATSVGCRAVPLNSLWGVEELTYAVKDSDCKVIFCDQQRCDLLKSFTPSLGCKLVICGPNRSPDNGPDITPFENVVTSGSGKEKPSTKDCKKDGDAMIMYTSGSTGFPKGVVHSQRSLSCAFHLQEMSGFALPDAVDGRTLLTAPLFHITALINIFLNAVATGAQIHPLGKWDAGKALDIIEKHKITRFTGVPTMIRDILEHPSFTAQRIASLKSFAGGGSAVPPSLQAKVHSVAKGAGIQGYGLTETCGGVVVNKGTDALLHPTSCGRPIPLLVKVCAKDPETGRELGNGERGEICVRCALNMSRYHNRPEDTAKAIDDDGWFHTGDIGRVEGGFVYIMDRMKDLINRAGEKIDCTEVETAVYSHPAVRECSVFGLPDPRLQEVVGLAVWLKAEATAEELSAHCAAKLAKFKVPEPQNIYFHTEELPKGATGKIDKKGLREKYTKMMVEKRASLSSFA